MTMALAIKSFTARHAYRDLTLIFTDRGRTGRAVNCPRCGEEHVLYYGPQVDEAAAMAWVTPELLRTCGNHTGWLSHSEAPPVTTAEHRQRIGRAIVDLQRHMEAQDAAAQTCLPGPERDGLILASERTQGEINELREELA